LQAFVDSRTKPDEILYVGTYNARGSEGIYGFRFDAHSGSLTPIGLLARAINPSFLVLAADQRFLYAVSETNSFNNQASGSICTYKVERTTGALTFRNEVASLGAGPCHLSLGQNGRYLMVANFQGGNIAIFPIMSNGCLGEATAFVQDKGSSVHPQRQDRPHAHAIAVSPDDRHVVAADLGMDLLLVWPFDLATGRIATAHSIVVEPGSGPRHFCFHPNGRFLYLVNEISSSIIIFSYDKAFGDLRILQTISSLPREFSGHNDASEIATDSTGRYLYVSNRGADSIHVFGIDAETGLLDSVANIPSGGKAPIHFVLDPRGRFLLVANRDSDNIATFQVDRETGRLTPVAVLHSPSPACLAFLHPR
jgi:6-phosphogluconolactonase